MTAIRKTFTWMFVLLVIIAAGGGGYAYWFLSHSDELVREILLDKLVAAAPGWQADIPEARLDLWGRVRVYDLSLRRDEQSQPAVSLPETIIVLDRSRLADQEVVIQQVRLLRPTLELVRDRRGHWNLEGIHPPPTTTPSQPEVFIEQGTLTFRITHKDGQLSPAITMRDVNLELTPTGKLRYNVRSDFQWDKAGLIRANGEFDLVAKTWQASGSIDQLSVDTELVRELAGFFPQQVWQLDRSVKKLLASNKISVAVPDQLTPTATAASGDSLDAMLDRLLRVGQLSAKTAVTFQAKQWQEGTPVEFGAKLTLAEGRLQSIVLPFDLLDLGGEIVVNNTRINTRGLTARNGIAKLKVDGYWLFLQEDTPAKFQVNVANLPVDTRLRSRMPSSWKKYYDDTRPSGFIDVEADLEFNRVTRWEYRSVVQIKDGAAQHVKFPYPLTNLRGWVIQDGPKLEAELTGLAGDRPLTLTANVRHPGPLAESEVKIHVERLPVDNKLMNACSPPAQKALQLMNLRGTIDADVTLYRPPGPGHKHRPSLIGKLHNCTVTYAHFPYDLKNVNGSMTWDSEDWTFTNMTAVHGVTQVAGEGEFLKQDGGLLDMKLRAVNALFESEELYYALPDSMKQLMKEFEPQGRFDIDAHVTWSPGTVPVVDIPRLDLKEDSIKLRSFPFPFHGVSGRVSVKNDLRTNQRDIEIANLTAKHGDDKFLKLSGGGQYFHDGEWHVSFDELYIEDLDTGNRFRKALPKALRAFFESTDPRGNSITAKGQLALRGTPGPHETVVTASWNIDIFHAGTTLTAGVNLENLQGRVNLKGSWDNEVIQGTGWLDLQSVIIDGYQLTDVVGPMEFQNGQFVIGSRRVASSLQDGSGPAAPDDQERVTAKFIGGTLVLDGIATLDERNGYVIKVLMKDGYVERYTELYAPKQKKLRGRINGFIVFDGSGSNPDSFRGRGQLSIDPAALYELPVILQLTKTLSFLPPDKTAFDRAFAKFESSRHGYIFEQIDLKGDAISLRGRGTMRQADGALDLVFYSTVPRNELPVPIVGKVVNGFTEGWVEVRVTGTTGAPVIKDMIVPRLDLQLQKFLGVFTPQNPPQRPANVYRGPNPSRR